MPNIFKRTKIHTVNLVKTFFTFSNMRMFAAELIRFQK